MIINNNYFKIFMILLQNTVQTSFQSILRIVGWYDNANHVFHSAFTLALFI